MFTTSIDRRGFLSTLGAVAGATAILAPARAGAAAYPSRPLKIIVAFGPGGLSDLTTRELARLMQNKLGQAIVIDNKPSAGQVVGMQAAASAAPDGYTLLLGSTTGLSITPTMFRNFNVDTSGFVPVAPISTTANVLIAMPDFPASNLSELSRLAKSRQNPITYGSIGIGTTTHLGMEIFRKGADFPATHVPYKGDAPALLALRSREVDTAVVTMFSAQARIRSGEMKGLGVFQSKPDRILPQIQTTVQAGVPDADLPSWIGLFAPPGTPKAIVDTLEPIAREAVASSAFQEFLLPRGSESMDMDNKRFVEMIARQSAQLGAVIKSLRLQPE